MRIAITALLLVLLAAPAAADPEADARAALALAAAQSQVVAPDAYTVAHRALLERDVPLVVWVGLDCPPCRASLTECSHVHLAEFAGSSAPRVVVNVRGPDGKGYYFGAVQFDGAMSAAAIRRWIASSREWANPRPVQSPPQPTYQQPYFEQPRIIRGGSRGG